jgi:hypothetical protein
MCIRFSSLLACHSSPQPPLVQILVVSSSRQPPSPTSALDYVNRSLSTQPSIMFVFFPPLFLHMPHHWASDGCLSDFPSFFCLSLLHSFHAHQFLCRCRPRLERCDRPQPSVRWIRRSVHLSLLSSFSFSLRPVSHSVTCQSPLFPHPDVFVAS